MGSEYWLRLWVWCAGYGLRLWVYDVQAMGSGYEYDVQAMGSGYGYDVQAMGSGYGYGVHPQTATWRYYNRKKESQNAAVPVFSVTEGNADKTIEPTRKYPRQKERPVVEVTVGDESSNDKKQMAISHQSTRSPHINVHKAMMLA